MREYSRKSLERLSECHPDLQILFNYVLQHWDNTILVGHRNKEDQDKAFRTGKSKTKWPNSKHNKKPSMAVDVSPWPIPKDWGVYSAEELSKFRHFAFYVLGVSDVLRTIGVIEHSIRWGGDWDSDNDTMDNKFEDLVHFELLKE